MAKSETNWNIDDVATVRSVAQRLGVSTVYVYRLLEQGDLLGKQLGNGKTWLVYLPSVEEWERKRKNV
jgi:excisionase family DNA binding protein